MTRIQGLKALTLMTFTISATTTLFGQANVIKVDSQKARLTQVGALPKILKEASGLEISHGKYLWSHNDDGIPAVYCLDTLGNIIRAIHINASNRGWEDLAMNESGDMFIGSFGNNANNRRDLKIFKIANPEAVGESVTIPDIISFSYSDQKAFPPAIGNRNFDVDASFAWRGFLYLFTKNRSKPFHSISKIYKLTQEPGQQTAQLIDSLQLGEGPMINNWITGADLSPDQKTLALLFHDRVWFIRNFHENKFSEGDIYEIPLNHYSHKAGISFMTNDVIYIVDELAFGVLGGKVYTLDVTFLWRETEK